MQSKPYLAPGNAALILSSGMLLLWQATPSAKRWVAAGWRLDGPIIEWR